MTDPDDDRRRDPRAEIGIQAVVLVRHNPGVACSIENMSIGGASLSGQLTLQLGERVQLMFDVDGHPLDVAAEVIRVEHVDMSLDRVAVVFTGLTPEALEVIKRVIVQAIQHEWEQVSSTDD